MTMTSLLLLVGATGAVGRAVLTQALADPRVAQVVALTRRPLAAATKLANVVADFDNLPADAPWWKVDADRVESRPGEGLARMVARALDPLIPRRWKAVKPDAIAHALLDAALASAPVSQVIESKALHAQSAAG